MDLIIGGAYQGKLAYAMEHFHLTQEDLARYLELPEETEEVSAP